MTGVASIDPGTLWLCTGRRHVGHVARIVATNDRSVTLRFVRPASARDRVFRYPLADFRKTYEPLAGRLWKAGRKRG